MSEPKKKLEIVKEEPKNILVIEDGILRIGKQEDLKKNDWQYRMEDATKNYMLIDLDRGKAQPIVKSILNELDLFPEMRMLKLIQAMLLTVLVLILILFALDIFIKPTRWYMADMEKRMTDSAIAEKKVDPKTKFEELIKSQAKKWVQTVPAVK